MTNATVEGPCGRNRTCDLHGKPSIRVCCSGSICVDNVRKCRIAGLSHDEIDCHHVVMSGFKGKQLHGQGCQMLPFTGTIEWRHVPHS